MHIGRLSARLTPGVFVIEDLMIEGLTPQDRPFLTAKTITVEVPWWTIFSKKLIIESVAMTDWHMVVETYANGRHNFPKFTPKTPSKGPRRFTTTLRSVVALRGAFTYEDHVTPWTTSAANLNVQLYRPPVATTYIGRAGFSNGTVRDPVLRSVPDRHAVAVLDRQRHRPFRLHGPVGRWVAVVSHRRCGSRALARADLSDQVEDRFPRRRRASSSMARKFTASGQGNFTGTFHLFKGGRELKGTSRARWPA